MTINIFFLPKIIWITRYFPFKNRDGVKVVIVYNLFYLLSFNCGHNFPNTVSTRALKYDK